MRREERFGRAVAVVGMQYGSEGKGGIVSYLSKIANAVVRTGGANAGHTMYHQGHAVTLQQIPCGWASGQAKLVLGVDAVIHLPTLIREIELLKRASVAIHNRLFIDRRATVATAVHITREQERGLAQAISSTSSRARYGIAEAVADRVLRSHETCFAEDVVSLQSYLCDTVDLLNSELDSDGIVLFEGTQGALLSLLHGPYPYVTSRDTTAQALFTAAGVNPYGFDVDVIGVVRRYPIRVAGNSGPFGSDVNEITWEQVAAVAGTATDLTEYTSVTGLPRRVADFSWTDFSRACMLNRPTELAFTFADHIDWSVHNRERLTESVVAFMNQLETVARSNVTLLKTGPDTLIDLDRYRQSILRRL